MWKIKPNINQNFIRFDAEHLCQKHIDVQDINNDGYADLICTKDTEIVYALGNANGLPTRLYDSPDHPQTIYMNPDDVQCDGVARRCQGDESIRLCMCINK